MLTDTPAFGSPRALGRRELPEDDEFPGTRPLVSLLPHEVTPLLPGPPLHTRGHAEPPRSWGRLAVGATGAGRRFTRYEIVATLQRGGMGEVVLAEVVDGAGARSRVVLKRLLADLLDDDRYLAMLLAEADVMSRLDHPNIVKVFDAPIVEGKQCVAMEYVHGKNAHHVLRRAKNLGGIPPDLAVHVIAEVLRGLGYAHAFVLEDGRPLDLVHRDVTPGNVLISFDGQVKITDFGVAKSKMSRLATTVGVVKGTTRYLSPEQVRGDVVTARSDLFSAASVLIELLTGAPLFDCGTVPSTLFAIASGQRAPVDEILPFHAPELADVLERALSLNARDRPSSAEELRAELLSAAAELGPPVERRELAAFVRDLFPEDQAPLALFETSESNAAGLDGLDLTYLFELRDPIEAEGDHVRAALTAMAPGAQPLDSSEFAGEPTPPAPKRREWSRRLVPLALSRTKERSRVVPRRPRAFGLPQFIAGALLGLACGWLIGHLSAEAPSSPVPVEAPAH